MVNQDVIVIYHDMSPSPSIDDHLLGGDESPLLIMDDEMRSTSCTGGDTVDGALNEFSPTSDKKRPALQLEDDAPISTVQSNTKKRKPIPKK